MKDDNSPTALPSYKNPPVIEVVCGIQFKPLEKLLVPHYGELWEKFKPDYEQCQENAPIVPAIERFDKLPATDIQIPSEPFLPRVWFVHKDGSGVIQVQRDRFLHNWRKTEADYPRYGRVINLFQAHYATFVAFLDDRELGTVEPLQCEMTYINHMPQSEGWEIMEDFSKVFPDFPWHSNDPWKPDKKRFLPTPEGRNLRLNFALPDKTGRLHVTIRNGVRLEDERAILLMELTVRGIGADKSAEAMKAWFDKARLWIVRGFADLTGKDMQDNIWRRAK